MTHKRVEAERSRGDATGTGQPAAAPVPLRRRMRRWSYHRLVRLMMLVHNTVLFLAKRLGPKPRQPRDGQGYEILVTGRFDSENWAAAHLRPLATSRYCAHLAVVSTNPIPTIPKVVTFHPPGWLIGTMGATGARLIVFAWTALWHRPHVVGGFHMKVNGLLAAVLGPLIGARTIYFCVGGPTEVLDGGIWGEGTFFERMETPDTVVERRLLSAVRTCSLVVTMGTSAAAYYHSRGAQSVRVISGGIDDHEFSPEVGENVNGLILVGRLVEVKRVDLFLRLVAKVSDLLPEVQAAVVGDGPLRGELEQLARDLGVAHRVHFAGFQRDVGKWLRRSKLFVLTSRSEGLSLALMEAMMCGLPAVVSHVGDLGDLVKGGVNGYLVGNGSMEAFAAHIADLLTDATKYAEFSRAARREALRYETRAAASLWDCSLTDIGSGARPPRPASA